MFDFVTLTVKPKPESPKEPWGKVVDVVNSDDAMDDISKLVGSGVLVL